MYTAQEFNKIPNKIGIYAFFRHPRANQKPTCAYVGMSGKVGSSTGIRVRIRQHLVEQTSTAGSRRSPAGLHIERITHVKYWTGGILTSKVNAQAAELVAMDVLHALLRSESGISPAARELAKQPSFRRSVEAMLEHPTVIELPNLDNTATLARTTSAELQDLKARVDVIEATLAKPGSKRNKS